MFLDIWIYRRIRIKIMSGYFYRGKMIGRMHAQQFVIRRHMRLPPFPIRMSIFQQRSSARDTLRAFRVPKSGVFQTTLIVKNDHRRSKSKCVRKSRLSCESKALLSAPARRRSVHYPLGDFGVQSSGERNGGVPNVTSGCPSYLTT